MPRTKSHWIRRNFTVSEEDSARLDELAALIAPPGEEPNASLAHRLAVREALERRKKKKPKPE